MHIIFGKDKADILKEKYTVLELDTIKFPDNGPEVTAYCTIEKIDFTQLAEVDEMAKLHTQLIEQYRARNWTEGLSLIDQLTGFWNGEVDSFYSEMRTRLEHNIAQEPDASWSPVIQK